jgi:hypothetical protein
MQLVVITTFLRVSQRFLCPAPAPANAHVASRTSAEPSSAASHGAPPANPTPAPCKVSHSKAAFVFLTIASFERARVGLRAEFRFPAPGRVHQPTLQIQVRQRLSCFFSRHIIIAPLLGMLHLRRTDTEEVAIINTTAMLAAAAAAVGMPSTFTSTCSPDTKTLISRRRPRQLTPVASPTRRPVRYLNL